MIGKLKFDNCLPPVLLALSRIADCKAYLLLAITHALDFQMEEINLPCPPQIFFIMAHFSLHIAISYHLFPSFILFVSLIQPLLFYFSRSHLSIVKNPSISPDFSLSPSFSINPHPPIHSQTPLFPVPNLKKIF